jgi:hypothetical protein
VRTGTTPIATRGALERLERLTHECKLMRAEVVASRLAAGTPQTS